MGTMEGEKHTRISHETKKSAKETSADDLETQKELLELIQAVGQLADEEVAKTDREMTTLVEGRRRAVEAALVLVGNDTDDPLERKEMRKKTSFLLKKLKNVQRIYKKIVPFLLPLVFSGGITRTETRPNDTSFNNRAVAARQLKKEGTTR